MLILIVDSSVPVIERLIALITETETATSISYASAYHEAVSLFRQNQPDVVVLDMNLPENKSMELLKLFGKHNDHTVIIALSNNADHQLAGQCRMNGAAYFFDKYHDYEQVPGIIRDLAAAKALNDHSKE